MVQEYTLLLLFLHPSFVGRAKVARDFFATKNTKKTKVASVVFVFFNLPH